MRRREPAVAGTFYPNSRQALESQILGFLEEAARERGDAPLPSPKALIAPHAGTIYSGPIAGSAYARLLAARGRIERVVLVGPAHRVWFEGVAKSSAELFSTPLGDIPVDPGAELVGVPGVVVDDEAHRLEHSLEVHLPFLQIVLGSFTLLPLVVGQASAESVARVLDAVWGGDETLVVVSSDLSHFHDYETANAMDRETTRLLESLDGDALTGDRACGYQPIRGLLHTARRRGLSCQSIDLRNSGDTAGPRREVVGYGSYVLG